jgi:ABC-2 type transport system permease protein
MRDTYRLVIAKGWIFRNGFTRPGKTERLKSLFFFTLTLVFLGALFYGSLAFFQKLAGEEPFGSLLAHKLVEFLFLTFFAILTFSSIITSLNAFFLDNDLPMLLTAPQSFGHIYLARFLQTFVMTGWMVILFGLPVFLACGIVFEAPLYYYPWMLCVLIAFEILPVALGSLITIILVKAFPARKMQDILIILAVILVVVLYFLFRFIKPEQLFNPDLFHGFAEYFATLRTPDSPLLPSSWGSIALLAPLDGKTGQDGIFFLLTMLSWGLFAIVVGTWVANRAYLDAFSKSQEGRRLTLTGTNFIQAVFSRLASSRNATTKQIYLKEIRSFFRDTTQWTQLMLLLALVVVYLFNFKALDLDRFAGITKSLRTMIAFINLGLAGFVLSAISVRFVLPAISLEGKAFWIIRTAPVSLKHFVWGKFRFYAIPLFIVCEILIVLSNLLLNTPTFIMIFSVVIMGMLSVAITALAIGVGAIYPNFAETNVAKMTTGVSSIIYMSLTQALIIFVIGLSAYPAELMMRVFRDGSTLSALQVSIIVLACAIVLVVIPASIIVPIKKGIQALENREY